MKQFNYSKYLNETNDGIDLNNRKKRTDRVLKGFPQRDLHWNKKDLDDLTDILNKYPSDLKLGKFLEVESSIKDPKLYWYMFHTLYTYSDFTIDHTERIVESIKRYNRKDIYYLDILKLKRDRLRLLRNDPISIGKYLLGCLIDRIHNKIGSDIFSISEIELYQKGNFNHKKVLDDLIATEDSYIKEKIRGLGKIIFQAQDSYIKLYRGFSCPDECDIRKGRLKVGNPHAHTQDIGRGIAYTTERSVATIYATRHLYLDPVYDILVKGDQQLKDRLLTKRKNNSNKMYLNAKPVIGEYWVRKDNILFAGNQNSGDYLELWCLPDDVDLNHYSFASESDHKFIQKCLSSGIPLMFLS